MSPSIFCRVCNRISQTLDVEQFNKKSLLRLSKVLTPLAKALLGRAVSINKGVIVVESLYDDPSVKSSFFSVLTGDQGYIDHRDPKKVALIAEALAVLERERLIFTFDPQKAFFRATSKGTRFITGAKFPTKRDLRRIALVVIWLIASLAALVFIMHR